MKDFIVFLLGCCVGALLENRREKLPPRNNEKAPIPDVHNRHRPSSSFRTPAEKVGVPAAATIPAAAEAWFNDRVMQYEKEVLAYCIYEKAEAMSLPVKNRMVLQKEYGTILLRPSFDEFEYGFQKEGLSAHQLNELGVMWLKKHHVAADVYNWEKNLDAFVLSEQQKKASDIVAKASSEKQ
ncbi:MAG: hypothetical protein MJ078_04245 [Clostridia bacterium]|nr:hypothetical protein [Clostridia bacterium]